MPLVLLGCTISVLVLAGCARYGRVVDECLSLAQACRYDEALAKLEASSLARSERDRLLYLLEKGTLQHLQGDFAASTATLEAADALAERLYTLSLTAEGFSFALNDNVTPYVGAPYETLYLNYVKGLNFLAAGELGGAVIECRKIAEKLAVLRDREETLQGGEGFLRLFCGLVFEADHEHNDALVAYRLSREAYARPESPAPPDLLLPRLRHAAKVVGVDDEMTGDGVEPVIDEPPPFTVLLVHHGRIPQREESFILAPSGEGFPVKLAVPRLVDAPPPNRGVELCVADQCRDVPVAVDLAAVAARTLEHRIHRDLAKSVARGVLKEATAREIEQHQGAGAALIARLLNLVSEQADLRAWSSLPREIRVVLVPGLPDGTALELRLNGHEQALTLSPYGDAIRFGMVRLY